MKLKQKLKVLAAALAIVAVTSVLLYVPLTNAFQSDEEPELGPEPKTLKNQKFVVRCCRKPRPFRWFFRHSEPVEIGGTVVALFKDMLIVDASDKQVRIHLPLMWTVDGKLVERGELQEGGYLTVGEEATVKALRFNAVEKECLCIYLLLGYEIINECNVHAYGVLPFSIET